MSNTNYEYTSSNSFGAGTLVYTQSDTYAPIETLVGETVTLFDGDQWVQGTFRKVTVSYPIYLVHLNNGVIIPATNGQRFIFDDGTVDGDMVFLGQLIKDPIHPARSLSLKTANINSPKFVYPDDEPRIIDITYSHLASNVYSYGASSSTPDQVYALSYNILVV